MRQRLAAHVRRLVGARPGVSRSSDLAAALAGVVGTAVHVQADHLEVGDGYAATLVVTGYPTDVGLAWLEPLLSWPGYLHTAVHVTPIVGATAAGGLRRQRARLESSRRLDADRGRLDDPLVEAAAEDAAELADRIARGQSRLFRVGIYLTVHAPSLEDLREAVADLRALAAAHLLDLQPATWRQLNGWTSTLPLVSDTLGLTRVFDTDALAASFPLASADLPGPLPGEPPADGGVLYGTNIASGGLVWWDRWACDNHNCVVLARSGAGKSYFVKLDVLRQLYDGVHVAVIDPEDEYHPLADATGGSTTTLGAPGVRINPLDLPNPQAAPPGSRPDPDLLARRVLFLHTLVAVLLGESLPPDERAALDRAALKTYADAGITNDPATWHRPAPLLRDLAATLAQAAEEHAASGRLAERLWPWTEGSFRGIFDGPTTHRPAGHLTIWSMRHLPDELRPAGMLLALDAIWNEIDRPAEDRDQNVMPRRRLVVVDEAWTLLQSPDGARFLQRLAKAARKRQAGLTVISQDAADLLATDLGQAVIANSATQILMRQAPQAMPVLTAAFKLAEGESEHLLSAERGDALLLAGAHRVIFHAVASSQEHELATDEARPA